MHYVIANSTVPVSNRSQLRKNRSIKNIDNSGQVLAYQDRGVNFRDK